MSGTKEGAAKTKTRLLEKYGEEYYVNIGRSGGQTPTNKLKGFAAMPREKVSAAGKLGGSRSRKG